MAEKSMHTTNTDNSVRVCPGMNELVGDRFFPIGGGAPEDGAADWSSLDDAQLQEALDEAITQFDELSASDTVSDADLQTLRGLTAKIDSLRAEQTARAEAAENARKEIEEMTARVKGTPSDETNEEESDEEDSDEDDDSDEAGETDTEGETEQVQDPAPAIAAAARKYNLRDVRSRQKKRPVAKETSKAKVTITAAADVGVANTGEEIDLDTLVEAVGARARGISSKGGKRNTALVASYRIPFDEALIVDSDGNAGEGTRALVAAADQSRLPGGDITASGGWCAPSETVYDIADIACPDQLWSPPEIQLRRGGLRYVPTPTLSVDELTWVWTEEDDIAAATDPDLLKDCFHVVCPDFLEVRCEAIGACVESGLLTERAYPELTSWYTRNAMVAHEIALKRRMFLAAVNHALTTSVTTTATFGAFTAIYGAVALQAADMVERHSLCDRIGVEVTFPGWARNLFLSDIARQNGRSIDEIDPAVITRAFDRLGVRVDWARGLAPDVPTNIGGATPGLGWPESIPFLIHPAGAVQIGRGDVVDLGVVQDSVKFSRNDYTALFTEECVAMVVRGPEVRFVTVPVCPDGTTGAQATSDVALECPIDGGTVTGSGS